jgi:transporter family protein
MSAANSWLFWALLSGVFAALTAIFAKVGVAGVAADLATLIRTVIILAMLFGIVAATRQWQAPGDIAAKTWIFLVLSGLATGASWACYFRALKLGDAARVAPVDKLSIIFVALFGVLFLGEKLTLANWLGVGFCVAGIVLIALK